MGKKYTHIIWDWNGTLLNDIDLSVEVINKMLMKRSMKPLKSIEAYHQVFCFPITQYYKNVGFDFEKEPFEKLAKEYVDLYYGNNRAIKLHDNALNIVKEIYYENLNQIILSATEQKRLIAQTDFFNITGYFNEILGISDIYAASKIETGKKYMVSNAGGNAVVIGDTYHDFEVASEIGADCILIANGHQSRETLLSTGTVVLNNLSEVYDVLFMQ